MARVKTDTTASHTCDRASTVIIRFQGESQGRDNRIIYMYASAVLIRFEARVQQNLINVTEQALYLSDS